MQRKWAGAFVLLLSSIVAKVAAEPLVEEARQKRAVGNKEKAAILYRQVIEKDNTNVEARRELASLLIEAQINAPYEEQSDVIASLEENVADPVIPFARFPLSFLSNGALASEDASMNRPVLQVLQKLQNNDNNSAVKLAERLHKKYPEHPVPYNLLGLAWQGRGDPTKAQEFFEKALILKENFHAARINLAELELHLGEFGAAHEALDAVLKNDMHNRRACLVKAQLYALEGRKELSKLWYAKVSESL